MRSQLIALRDALQRLLFEEAKEAPYIDYYFDELTSTWYESGYDGRRYFSKRITQPVLLRRRPLIQSN